MIIKDKKYQKYFKEFIKQNNLKIGDKIKTYEYIFWINNKHKKFQKHLNKEQYYIKDYSEKFYNWLINLEGSE